MFEQRFRLPQMAYGSVDKPQAWTLQRDARIPSMYSFFPTQFTIGVPMTYYFSQDQPLSWIPTFCGHVKSMILTQTPVHLPQWES
jgi:hypothetical protein